MVHGVGRGVQTAGLHPLWVDGEEGLAVRGDDGLLSEVILHAAIHKQWSGD